MCCHHIKSILILIFLAILIESAPCSPSWSNARQPRGCGSSDEAARHQDHLLITPPCVQGHIHRKPKPREGLGSARLTLGYNCRRLIYTPIDIPYTLRAASLGPIPFQMAAVDGEWSSPLSSIHSTCQFPARATPPSKHARHVHHGHSWPVPGNLPNRRTLSS